METGPKTVRVGVFNVSYLDWDKTYIENSYALFKKYIYYHVITNCAQYIQSAPLMEFVDEEDCKQGIKGIPGQLINIIAKWAKVKLVHIFYTYHFVLCIRIWESFCLKGPRHKISKI